MIEGPSNNRSERIILDKDFYKKFLEQDQNLMRSGTWDYKDSSQILHAWKQNAEAISDNDLSEEQLNNKYNALWLWYHHASQAAFFKHQDKETAISFIDKALECQQKTHSQNWITPLLKLLYTEQLDDAKQFIESMPSTKTASNSNELQPNYEKETARNLLSRFEKSTPPNRHEGEV